MSYHHDAGQSAGARSGYFNRPGGQKNKKGLLGLSNLGNTCFMNAALQCMTHTHGLQKYYRWCSHAYASKGQSSRQKLLMSFAHWFERDWGKNVSANYHTPEDILRSVQQLNPIFQGYAQQDSQEFLRCVLDNMHEELRREVPDDLQGHLRKSFGIEAQGELSPSSSSANSQSSQRGASRNESMSKSASSRQDTRSKASTSSSAQSRNFMQLCQSTEGVTDVGEIRLPETPAPLSSSPTPSTDFSTHSGRTGSDEQEAENESGKSSASAKKEDEEEKTHFESIISELFQGKVVSVVTCLECQKTSRTQEICYDVSVPIPNANELSGGPGGMESPNSAGAKGSAWTNVLGGIPGKVKGWFYDKGVEITDCLRKYTAPEYLNGKDKYYCEHCKRKNDCEKRIIFKDLPEVLCIHIKRFRYDAGWFNGTKNSKVVTFPVNKPLDMSGFLDEPPLNPVEYKLIGLIQHIGSMGGGHYISYCQHKRKPQDWYEFDDLQTTLVSPDQVERAEPYVLFYQRMPSKGCKLDRQTFKNDQKRVQSQIRSYLMNRGAGDGASALSDNISQSSLQSASEEMRHHGPALRNLYKKPPPELDMVFVSKHWYVRLTTMSEPGPLDNYMYLCPHQCLGSHSAEMAAEPFIPISRNLWLSLVKKYGGGPVINALELCTKCQTYIRAYNERKQAEFDLVSKYDTKDTGEGKNWYIVDALWVNKWKRYVRADHVTDIADVSAPGPISNSRLFDKDNPGRPRDKLKLRIDYIGVNARVWWLFMHVHGGGPIICREELDIYSAECPPETDLFLEELRGKGSSEYSRRISRQFVDECRGDLSLYNQMYGSADEDQAMQVDRGRDSGEAGSKDDMEDTGDRAGDEDWNRRKDELEERVRRLTAEVDGLRRRTSERKQEQETQVIAARSELQLLSQTAGAEAQSRLLREKLESTEDELLREQRSGEESIHAADEQLRQSKLELKAHLQRS